MHSAALPAMDSLKLSRCFQIQLDTELSTGSGFQTLKDIKWGFFRSKSCTCTSVRIHQDRACPENYCYSLIGSGANANKKHHQHVCHQNSDVCPYKWSHICIAVQQVRAGLGSVPGPAQQLQKRGHCWGGGAPWQVQAWGAQHLPPQLPDPFAVPTHAPQATTRERSVFMPL